MTVIWFWGVAILVVVAILEARYKFLETWSVNVRKDK